MKPQTKTKPALDLPSTLHSLVVVGVLAFGFLSASTAMADVTKYPRDGRYCDNTFGQTDKGTIDPGPFFMLGMAVIPSLHPVAMCDGDVENVKSFWRSYYRYFGCTADSDVGRTMESMLKFERQIYSPSYDPAWTYIGENPQFCETIRSQCTLPPVFNPEEKESAFTCRLDELLEELKKGAREIEKGGPDKG